MKSNHTTPKFRTDQTKWPVKVFLLCSACEKDIRELSPMDKINVTMAHYCKDCDPGTVVLNQDTDTVN